MAETQSKQWGVTAPISSAPPTAKDLKLNDELIEELKRQNVFESPEGSDMRYGYGSAACIDQAS
jgi:poly(A) polymerase